MPSGTPAQTGPLKLPFLVLHLSPQAPTSDPSPRPLGWGGSCCISPEGIVLKQIRLCQPLKLLPPVSHLFTSTLNLSSGEAFLKEDTPEEEGGRRKKKGERRREEGRGRKMTFFRQPVPTFPSAEPEGSDVGLRLCSRNRQRQGASSDSG